MQHLEHASRGGAERRENMSHHDNPTLLAQAIGKASELVTAVSYEYPDTWLVKTTKGEFLLGDVNGWFAWHNEEGNLSGQTYFQHVHNIALAFTVWLDGIGAK